MTLVPPTWATTTAGTGGDRIEHAQALYRAGSVAAAVAELAGTPTDDVGAAALLACCHLAQGDVGAALALADQLAHHPDADTPDSLFARAEVAGAVADVDLALERYLAVGEAAARTADPDRVGLRLPWRAGAALVLGSVTRTAEAAVLAADQLALARRCGDDVDVALALRVVASVESGDRGARLREALDTLDRGTTPAARLRAQLLTDLAGVLVLDGAPERAVPLLRRAEAYAGAEGLWPLRSRVRRLLERTGETPHRAPAELLAVLTTAERRVARLVLDGHGNRTVAERLEVSVKAVEGHLSKIYRKVGVRSRKELVASVAG